MAQGRQSGHASLRLSGWKAIAAHLGRDQSTVRRWAAGAGLPVHRPGNGVARKGAAVFALTDELDAWIIRFGRAAGDRAASVGAAGSVAAGDPAAGGDAVVAWPVAPGTDPSVPPAARSLYLEAAYLWQKRTPEALRDAESRLVAALDIAPGFARAHAELAVVHDVMADYEYVETHVGYRLAAASARRALDLDPRNARAHCVLADVGFFGERRFAEGLALFRRAAEMEPADPLCHHWYGSALSFAGHHAEAQEELLRARMLVPASRLVIYSEAVNLLGMAEFTAARTRAVDLLKNEPGFVNPLRLLAFAELGEGNLPGYLEALGGFYRRRQDGAVLALLERASARMANAELPDLARFMAQDMDAGMDAYFRAHVLALNARWTEAADLLARVPDCTAFYNAVDPAFRGAHLDAGFRRGLRHAQLPPG